jgi:hypothetical protein
LLVVSRLERETCSSQRAQPRRIVERTSSTRRDTTLGEQPAQKPDRDLGPITSTAIRLCEPVADFDLATLVRFAMGTSVADHDPVKGHEPAGRTPLPKRNARPRRGRRLVAAGQRDRLLSPPDRGLHSSLWEVHSDGSGLHQIDV